MAIAQYRQQAEVVVNNASMNYKRMTDLSNVGTAGAKVFGSMASSALSGMNALASAIETKSL